MTSGLFTPPTPRKASVKLWTCWSACAAANPGSIWPSMAASRSGVSRKTHGPRSLPWMTAAGSASVPWRSKWHGPASACACSLARNPLGTWSPNPCRAGCIPVASQFGAYPELIRDGVDGYLIPPGAPADEAAAAADRILDLVRSPSKLERIRHEARRVPWSCRPHGRDLAGALGVSARRPPAGRRCPGRVSCVRWRVPRAGGW